MNIFDLNGKIAVVTGGAGGIGAALALGIADAGADVVVTSRNLAKLEEVAEQIKAKGKKSLAISTDVTDAKSVEDMTENVLKTFGRIDILVNG
ncbi:MAG: SDR family NAD(P)-dependent oxidoreductase, partial [Dehalococcoidales bacterium]